MFSTKERDILKEEERDTSKVGVLASTLQIKRKVKDVVTEA